jgi:DNA-directed DNA polymerase III PolC
MFQNIHSYFSLHYGTLSIEQIIELVKLYGYKCAAITDINNSTGVLDFVKHAFENDIKPIVGMDFRNGDERLFTCLAKNNDGFREINELQTKRSVDGLELSHNAPGFNDAYVIYPFEQRTRSNLKENEFIGVGVDNISKIYSLKQHKEKLVIFNPATFYGQNGYELHQHLRAIGHNILLSQLEPVNIAKQSETFYSKDQLLAAYKEYPHIIKNTQELLNRCSFNFNFKEKKNFKCFTDSLHNDNMLLGKLAQEGFAYRYSKNNQKAIDRFRKELAVIYELKFASYFLIAHDIINFSMSKGFYHVGRGSGANSIVAYCLKITDVDPIELDLYFERFLNTKRSEPPDFDIDYSWKDRDEVQNYIFKKYGKRHVALLGVNSRFKGKSIIRELGKVYGLPKEEIDAFTMDPVGKKNDSHIHKQVFDMGQKMAQFPNVRSIHAGGILISDKPITYYTALDFPPKGFPTTQWDMYVAREIGFDKLDILSQRGIGHINEAVEIIKTNKRIDVDPHQVDEFKKDQKVKQLLKTSDTNGCFYVESPAMRGLLKKLRCDNYLSLVAASSIIRPGVAKSGMMREYIHRFHHPNDFKYLHPIMKEQLEETYGVMVYQEDVLKICYHFAGLDLADADVLRVIMSGKPRFKHQFEQIKNKFFTNCKQRGYPDEVTAEVWRQIYSFAGYSFSKAHSASYAVESYQSLYLKAHYPLEFMVAVINNFGGFYQRWVYFNEVKKAGATVNLPCVNNSFYKTSIKGTDVYIGFIHVANLEHNFVENLLEERQKNGLYKDFEDFIDRVPSSAEQLTILIRIDAFRFTGISKVKLLWKARLLIGKSKSVAQTNTLFSAPRKEFKLPDVSQSKLEDAYDEIEFLDFSVSLSAFDMLETSFRGEVLAGEMIKHVGKKVRILGNLVTTKYVRTSQGEVMYFGTFLDYKGAFFDSVNFPNSLKKYPFTGKGVYLILGTITEEFDFPSITVEKMAKMPFKPDPRY